MLLGFIERDEEHVQVLLPEIQDSLAFAGNTDPGWRPVPEPRKDLVAGIRAEKSTQRSWLLWCSFPRNMMTAEPVSRAQESYSG